MIRKVGRHGGRRFFPTALSRWGQVLLKAGPLKGRLNRAIFIPRRSGSIAVAWGLLLLLCLAAMSGEREEQPVMSYSVANQVIALDPGHGGFDPGAQRGDICEKDLTLSICKKLSRHLSKAGSLVVLIREGDKDLSDSDFQGSLRERKRQDLSRRAEKANQAKASLFVSIHANADPSPRWRGAQVFYNGSSEASRLAAEAIQEELTRVLGNTNRKALAGTYYITQKTRMPAVIVEIGFISNPEEGRLLMTPEYQDKVAYAIYAGIVKAQSRNSQPAMANP